MFCLICQHMHLFKLCSPLDGMGGGGSSWWNEFLFHWGFSHHLDGNADAVWTLVSSRQIFSQ